MRIVRFAAAYHETVLELHRKAMKPFAPLLPQKDEEVDLHQIEQVYLRHGEFLVGLLGDRVVAMGGFKPHSATIAELKRIRIDPEKQGQGYGSDLLRDLEKRAVELGFSSLYLETAKARTLTLAFYDKQGYLRVGEGFYGSVEVVRYTKELPKTKRRVGAFETD